MWHYTQIRNFNEYILFNDFAVLFNIAKQIKGCHYYYISKEEHKIYGCDKEGFSLHTVEVPAIYEIPVSIYFDILLMNETIINQYGSFKLYKDTPWLMLPIATESEHNAYNLAYIKDKDSWAVEKEKDKVDCVVLYDPNVEIFTVKTILDLVIAKHNVDNVLGEMQYFGNLESNEIVRSVFDNKISNGRKYLKLTGLNGKSYGMFIFKNLFNLNKADTLTIIIRERLDKPNMFQASFVTTKKKSNIPTIIPFFVETTHAMFLNTEYYIG